MASEIFVPKGKCRRRRQVELTETVYWVPGRCTCSLGYTSEAGKALFHQNLFRLVILLLELSEGFLVNSSWNNNSKSVQQKTPLLISGLPKNLIKLPHCPLLVPSPSGLLSAKNLLAWFSQDLSWFLLIGNYQPRNTRLLSCESLPLASVEVGWSEMLLYPCPYYHCLK